MLWLTITKSTVQINIYDEVYSPVRQYKPYTTTTTVLRPFFRDYPGEPVLEEKLLDFMVQAKTKRGR